MKLHTTNVRAPKRGTRDRHAESGQVIILLVFGMTLLVMFAGLAIDSGLAYMTKARLVRAVDASCLTGMKNLAQGHDPATTLASSSFNANYPTTGLDAIPPVVNVGFLTSTNGQKVVAVTGTATIRTFFMRIVPTFKTLTITASAQATRGKLAMTMGLDRSGSMANNGGGTALLAAAPTFIKYFDDDSDEAAMAEFSSFARLDFPIGHDFVTPITNAINAMQGKFAGATFGLGALTIAKTQEDSVSGGPNDNLVKVVVYFTDGYVNTIQDTLNCNGTMTLYNFGGYDSGSSVGFFKPTDGTQLATFDGNHTWSPSTYCLSKLSGFVSAIDGHTKAFNRTNVTADAKYRSLQVTNAMRAEGITVYSIGLGSSIDQAFLRQIANDPASATYDPNQPVGMAVFASSCPSQTCTIQLQQVFQTIAARIMLRLTG
jgi:hypothetical protein